MGETQEVRENVEPLGIPVDTDKSPRDYGVPHDEWRPGQVAALNDLKPILEGEEKTKAVIVEAPTGTGKSSLPAALGHDNPVTVLVHSLGLLDQYEEKYGFAVIKGQQNYECVNPDVIQRFSEKQNRFPTAADCPYERKTQCPFVDECPYVQARERAMMSMRMACTYSYALVSPQIPLRGGILVADECFVAGTMVGNVPIEDIQVGNKILAYKDGVFQYKTVLAKSVRVAPDRLVKITLNNGTTIVCTPNHPILCGSEWVRAEDIKINDTLIGNGRDDHGILQTQNSNEAHLPLVQEGIRSGRSKKTLRLQKAREGILLSGARGIFQTRIQEETQGKQPGKREITNTHDKKQPDEEPRSAGKGQQAVERDESCPEGKRWKWKTTSNSAQAVGRSSWMGDRVDRSNQGLQKEDGNLCSIKLQNRHRRSKQDGCDRGRWNFSQDVRKTRAGQEEGDFPEKLRVESVEVLKRGSDGRFEQVCPDNLVYNLEIDDFNTYTANGVVVHNCHIMAESIVNNSTIEFTTKTITDWRLPQFPMGVYGTKDALDPRRAKILTNWLKDCIHAIGPKPYQELSDELAAWKAIKRRLDFALEEIELRWDNYYLECSSESYWFKGKERKREYLRLKPFTAARYSGKLTAGKDLAVLMSATIGDPKPLAEELGLMDYRSFSYPHPIPPAFRPVYDLGLPRMTYENLNRTKALPAIQANKIAGFISKVPPTWRGVVLTSSYAKLKVLREHLGRHLGDRLYIPPEGGPAERIAGFLRDQRDGLVAVDLIESWGTGLDLAGELARFVVIAGIPFPNFQKDPFARARSQKNGAAYLWWAAYTSIPQAAGRVVRGDRDKRGNYLPNIAVLADGSATSPRALASYPGYFREAIREWK